MKTLTKQDTVLTEIVTEIKILNSEEQEQLLVKLRAQRMLGQKPLILSKPVRGLKIPSLRQIDKWKHESRKVSLKFN